VREAASNILSEIPRTASRRKAKKLPFLGWQNRAARRCRSPILPHCARGYSRRSAKSVANGQTPALRRMQMLREAMDNTISGAADNASQADAGLLGRLSGDLGDFGTAAEARTGTGGYDSPGASTVSGGYAQAAPGVPGAAGNTARGSGGSPGYSRAQAPPKPQDISEFLISRGGVRDDTGELKAMDTNRVNGGYGTGGVGQGSFGVLSRKNGLPPDTAREVAEEAGYLPRGSTISDLYDAIHDSTRGIPRYADADADIVANWEHYAKTGEAPEIPDLPTAPANFDQEAAQRYRGAANATRDRAQTFNNQIVGPALQERGSEYRMLDSRVPEQFLRTPEGVQAFLSAGGDAATMRDALAADLRRTASNTDGTLKPAEIRGMAERRAAALRAFPNWGKRSAMPQRHRMPFDAVSAAARQQTLEFQKGAARHFLNAEPDKAVQSALASQEPGRRFSRSRAPRWQATPTRRLACSGPLPIISRATYIGNTEAGTSGVGTVKSDAFQNFHAEGFDAGLAQIFSPEQVQSIRAVAADLQRSNRSIASSKIPGQSNTMQDLALSQGKRSVLLDALKDTAIGSGSGLGGYLIGGPVGATVGAGLGVGKAALSRIKAAGIERTNQLVTEALLNPEIARTLLMKPTPGNRPLIAGSLRTAFGRIAAAAASRETEDRKGK
jgi:hypothetical protein